MKLYDINVSAFITLLEHAKGNIFLVTGDKVCFNLSSKLSQLYCIKMLLDGVSGNEVSPEIKIENKEDEIMFQQYLVNHNIKRGFSVR